VTQNDFLARFEGVRKVGDGYLAKCKAHPDQQASLSITFKSDRTLIDCHAGCSPERVTAAAGMTLADLFLAPRNGVASNGSRHNHSGAPNPLTLAQFAEAKGIPLEFLTQCGVVEEKSALVFHYNLLNGQRAPRQRIRLSLTGDKRFIWNKAEGRPVPYGLWRLDEARKRGVEDLFLVEGESDSLTLWAHDMTAIGIPGADNCKILQLPHVAGFQQVFIVRENDHGGEVYEKGCTSRLAELEFQGQVAVVEMEKAAVKDANELHVKMLTDPGGFESEWGALVEMARPVELPIVGLETFNASDVHERPLHWLWTGRIPLGKLVLFVGHPGLGKSFAALDLVARLSTGAMWPDGSPNGQIANSIVFSAEDSIEDTIVPRLSELSAAKGHVVLARRLREANESGEIIRRSFNLARDLPHLERTLDRNPETRLVVIDPVSAYMGRVDSHKNAEVRTDVLDPLAELAERRNVTVLAVTHFNKGSAGNSLERISGSVAFPAAARVVWGFARDPEDTNRRLMLFGKSNVGPEMPGLAFRIVGTDNGRATIEWIKGEIAENLNDVLRREQEAQKDASGGSKLEIAKSIWREMLATGPRPVTEIEDRARERNISETTLKRARWELGVKCSKKGFTGPWTAFPPSISTQMNSFDGTPTETRT